MGGPDVVVPLAVEVPAGVLRLLLTGVETLRPVPQPALDVGRKPLARQPLLLPVHHGPADPVREAGGLAAGEEPVQVGPGAPGPGDLAAPQGGRHDEAPRAAGVPGLGPVVSHPQTAEDRGED